MHIEEIIKLFFPSGLDKPYNKNILRKNPNIMQSLKDLTTFLPDTATTSERLFCIIFKEKPNICECGNKTKFKSFNKGYAEFCSKKCMSSSKKIKNKRIESTIKNNGGVGFASKAIADKIKRTNILKYGSESAMQNSDIKNKMKESWNKLDKAQIVEKRKKTSLRKYGTEFHQQNRIQQEKIKTSLTENYGGCGFASKKITEKIKKTNIIRYNTENPMTNSTIKERQQNTIKNRYGVKNISEVGNQKWNDFKNNFNPDDFKLEKSLQEMETEFGVRYYTIAKFLNNYGFEFSQISSYEQELMNLLPPDFKHNDRTVLNGKELDFYSETRKIAIEFNGMLYHSEKFGRDKFYHLSKSKECYEKGIYLIHIFEDDWLKNKIKIKQFLNNIIYNENNFNIENTKIKKISKIDALNFGKENIINFNDVFDIAYAIYDNDLKCVLTIKVNPDAFTVNNVGFKLDQYNSNAIPKLINHLIKIDSTSLQIELNASIDNILFFEKLGFHIYLEREPKILKTFNNNNNVWDCGTIILKHKDYKD